MRLWYRFKDWWLGVPRDTGRAFEYNNGRFTEYPPQTQYLHRSHIHKED